MPSYRTCSCFRVIVRSAFAAQVPYLFSCYQGKSNTVASVTGCEYDVVKSFHYFHDWVTGLQTGRKTDKKTRLTRRRASPAICTDTLSDTPGQCPLIYSLLPTRFDPEYVWSRPVPDLILPGSPCLVCVEKDTKKI